MGRSDDIQAAIMNLRNVAAAHNLRLMAVHVEGSLGGRLQERGQIHDVELVAPSSLWREMVAGAPMVEVDNG